MTDLPKCVLCKSEAITEDNGVWCADEHSVPLSRCPQSVGYYTLDQWRLLNDPVPQLSERTREQEREELARALWMASKGLAVDAAFKRANEYLQKRDEWRVKDGNE